LIVEEDEDKVSEYLKKKTGQYVKLVVWNCLDEEATNQPTNSNQLKTIMLQTVPTATATATCTTTTCSCEPSNNNSKNETIAANDDCCSWPPHERGTSSYQPQPQPSPAPPRKDTTRTRTTTATTTTSRPYQHHHFTLPHNKRLCLLDSPSSSTKLTTTVMSSTTAVASSPSKTTSSKKYIPPHLRTKCKQQQQQQQAQLSTLHTPAPHPHRRRQRQTSLHSTADATVPTSRAGVYKLGGCADPHHIQGSITDPQYISLQSSRLRRNVASEAFGWGSRQQQHGACRGWQVGAVSECGIRESNQDAYLVMAPKEDDDDNDNDNDDATNPNHRTTTSNSVFAIFDGHGGDEAARYAAEFLISCLEKVAAQQQQQQQQQQSS